MMANKADATGTGQRWGYVLSLVLLIVYVVTLTRNVSKKMRVQALLLIVGRNLFLLEFV